MLAGPAGNPRMGHAMGGGTAGGGQFAGSTRRTSLGTKKGHSILSTSEKLHQHRSNLKNERYWQDMDHARLVTTGKGPAGQMVANTLLCIVEILQFVLDVRLDFRISQVLGIIRYDYKMCEESHDIFGVGSSIFFFIFFIDFFFIFFFSAIFIVSGLQLVT